ncbi:hypothetical protein EJ357_31930 [Streptomyces cyaneochromogenes]|uniref:Uncharacterized protein n=1 Tax=Streptomyces cyaneochromogenes TaxID=2496836 RepID=A0A3Q9EWV5_9ACTN|nr:hypothetical protein [Streptomyces cyaneochromogenes]AZQ37495.1 hypothetical protein EJ357_31930 [Streptomyces cyaneochromogenes]
MTRCSTGSSGPLSSASAALGAPSGMPSGGPGGGGVMGPGASEVNDHGVDLLKPHLENDH